MLLVVAIYQKAIFLMRHRKSFESWLFLSAALLAVRFFVASIDYPQQFIQLTLFAPLEEPALFMVPSIGDLLLNVGVVFLIFWYLYLYFHHIIHLNKFTKTHQFLRKVLAPIWISFTFFLAFYHFYLLHLLYQIKYISLDFTAALALDIYKITALVLYLLVSLTYFFISHCLARLVREFKLKPYEFFLVVALGASVCTVATFDTASTNWPIIFLHTFFIMFLLWREIPRSVLNYSVLTMQYIIVSAIVSAMIGVYSIYIFEYKRKVEDKQRLASQLLRENDPFGEFLLADAIEKIRTDQLILNRFDGMPTNNMDIVLHKIKRIHLGGYFDRYDIFIHFFGHDKIPRAPHHNQNYDSLEKKYARAEHRTDISTDVYIISDAASDQIRYFAFINLENTDGIHTGNIVLELHLRKIFPNSVYPSLMVDMGAIPFMAKPDWSYGIFSGENMAFSYGSYAYEPNFMARFASEILSGNEIIHNGHRHLRISGNAGREVVITSPDYPIRHVISNFSFLLLPLLVVMLSASLPYYFLIRRQVFKFTFTTRLQFLVNSSFLLPTIVISGLVLSLLNAHNEEDTDKVFFSEAENLAQNITQEVYEYYHNRYTNDQLQQLIAEIARFSQTDVNLFDTQGRLIVSSQPAIYDNGLLSRRLNPSALADIVENNKNRVKMAESIGTLGFSAVYVGIKSFETGDVIAILGLPFFQSQQSTERQILGVVSIILNVFTVAFLALLVISHVASNLLTKPLRLITERIKGVTFGKPNEPVNYESSDEIGLLISEYNKMIMKLDESRAALARKEKESAWREMAKQVAHEIKNPLTPMKLTLQHLQRIMQGENESIKRYFTSLLEQIDTLSDISASFAAFAVMPIPKEEIFDVAKVLHQTALLYRSAERVKIELQIAEGAFFVSGDSKLMGRIFSNLILNAIQAMPPEREPEVSIVLAAESTKHILIAFADNGIGISEETQKKIFLPYFTTKTTGSGIGLAVAKRGIEHAKGRIWFESAPDSGSTFFIELPIVEGVYEETLS